jgi:hypothetical protein
MSSEILDREFIFEDDSILTVPQPLLQKKLIHSSVHDLEGFFWVLVGLCLSRDGPTRRRSELLPDNNDLQHEPFRTVFARTFEAGDDVLALTKQRMFVTSGYFVRSVLRNVPPYCQPLEPLLRQFYAALRRAHENHTCEGLYDEIINAFDDAEAMVAQLPPDFTNTYRDLKHAEEERRGRDGEGFWDPPSPPSKTPARTVGLANAQSTLQQCSPPSPTPGKRPKVIQPESVSTFKRY